jgi:type VI secretion system secreted protein VgrG
MPISSRTLSASSSAIPLLLGEPALVAASLSGKDGVNILFDYQLILKTPESLHILGQQISNLNLDCFTGQELTVRIELEGNDPANLGAGVREITGLIVDASFLRQEQRCAFYQVNLRPWLHLATLRSNCKIFQNQTVVELLESLLADYCFPVEMRLTDLARYPKRDYQTQYNESDYTFFCRLCEEWGINYFFEHSDGKQRLVLIDSMGAYRHSPSEAYRLLNFYPSDKRIGEESIHTFVPAHSLTSGQYSTRDYDYTRPRADLTASRSNPRPTAHSQQEVYEWHADAHYSQPQAGAEGNGPNDPLAEGDAIALLLMQALRSPGQRARGAGRLRAMLPGCIFTLQQHPMEAANIDYLILATDFSIEEVAQESQSPDSAQQYKVAVEFEVQPLRETLRPQRLTPKPYTHGPSSAIVVGPPGENIWTDALGRIKVQFPWDRLGKNDQHSSCWLRVVSPWAGNQLGAVQLPRIGQEVIVDFIAGDPDLPLCTGRVHNQVNQPPWSLPGQSALSGFRSRELTKEGGNAMGGRSNHLLMDDTEGRLQIQLRSDHQHSQLSLGYITRVEDSTGRKDARGEGFELRTDGHGAIRAKDGLLISTEARSHGQGHIKEMGETVSRLSDAGERHASQADLAQQHQAQDAGSDQSDVVKIIQAQNVAIKGSGGNAEEGRFPELAQPHLILSSPAGIQATTPQSIHLASGEHIALTSGGHVSLSIGQRWLASVKNGIRWFTYQAGMKLVAAAGDIDLQALKHSINLLAKLNITHIANRITITAKEEVLINGGGSYTRWNAGGIEEGTKGSAVTHAARHAMVGPASLPVALPQFPQAVCEECELAAKARRTRLSPPKL